MENQTFAEMRNVDFFSISSIQIGEEVTGSWTNFNVFSSLLSEQKMRSITTVGNAACEKKPAAFLKWRADQWVLSGNGGSVRELEFAERPCRRVSAMQIYHMEAMHSQADCMEHCQKLWGRSPSVQTEKDWEVIVEELTIIAGNISNIKNRN